MKLEETECSETSSYKIQTPGIYPEESKQLSFSRFLLDTNKNLNYFLGTFGHTLPTSMT